MKRMNDDEVMNYVYGKLFGDLDNVEAKNMFDDQGEGAVESAVPNAEPEMKGSGGVKVTIEPIMAASSEGSKPEKPTTDDADEDEEDRLKGISGMSPLMAQMHRDR